MEPKGTEDTHRRTSVPSSEIGTAPAGIEFGYSGTEIITRPKKEDRIHIHVDFVRSEKMFQEDWPSQTAVRPVCLIDCRATEGNEASFVALNSLSNFKTRIQKHS